MREYYLVRARASGWSLQLPVLILCFSFELLVKLLRYQESQPCCAIIPVMKKCCSTHAEINATHTGSADGFDQARWFRPQGEVCGESCGRMRTLVNSSWRQSLVYRHREK